MQTDAPMGLHETLASLVQRWGYAGVFLFIGAECVGVPLPGEVALVSASLYAATTHHLRIEGVIAAAVLGGVVGGAAGYALGRVGGRRLLARFGPAVGLTPTRQKVGRYLFDRHGGALVFVGRFVALLRTYAPLLAGTNTMPFGRFLAFHAAGSLAWACAYGLGAAAFGREITHVARPAGIALAVVAAIALVAMGVVMKRHERELEERAERAFP